MLLRNLFGIIWLTVSKVASREIIHSPEDERNNVLSCLHGREVLLGRCGSWNSQRGSFEALFGVGSSTIS